MALVVVYMRKSIYFDQGNKNFCLSKANLVDLDLDKAMKLDKY